MKLFAFSSVKEHFLRKDAETYRYQFGCGILKMVGPKKQDFWPKINILRGMFFKDPSMNYYFQSQF